MSEVLEPQSKPNTLDRILVAAGLSRRELRFDLEGITPAVARALPASARALAGGDVPECGFGLSGPAGIGKTGALAATLRSFARSRIRVGVPDPDARPPRLCWCSWPDVVNRMRTMSIRDAGIGDVELWVTEIQTATVLILDDLGAERIRGSYIEDWAASQLDLVVDHRYQDLAPTWYSTSLDAERLVGKYGQRLYSRLCGENPLIELPETGDRRLK